MNRIGELGKSPMMEDAFYAFLEWTVELGLELYPAQEEGIMDVMSDHHVSLNTPTGSGKSMVALGAHFWALVQGKNPITLLRLKLYSTKFVSVFATHLALIMWGCSLVTQT